MYQLPLEKKQYLLRSSTFSRASGTKTSAKHAAQASTYGPASAGALLPRLVPQLTGDSGLMKRFSITGWGTGSSTPVNGFPESSRSSGEFDSRRRESLSMTGKLQGEKPIDALPIQPQTTGSLWSSWWTSSGGEKASALDGKAQTKEVEKTAKWYVDGIRSGKPADTKLVKHLISLRVHLSTANLAWVEEFVVTEKGMDVLGKLLASFVGKGGKRKKLNDIEDAVLLEVIKCLRVLLNTEVSHGDYSSACRLKRVL